MTSTITAEPRVTPQGFHTLDGANSALKQLPQPPINMDSLTRPSSSNSGDDPVRDDHFYFQWSIFQVENTLFSVPRHSLLAESHSFRTMYQLPSHNTTEGMSDQRPITLNGITCDEFRVFLSVLYPQYPVTSPNLTLSGWMTLLKVATFWGAPKLRELSIAHLSGDQTFCEINKIVMAREQDVDHWLLPGYRDLVWRQAPMTEGDISQIGAAAVLKICALRETRSGTTTAKMDSKIIASFGLTNA